ncbi:MAG: adenylate/guanylate cyclase domain-containing protein [Spirochaetia bacterium]|nr:adenylate/guanylate cyclase domain-containing protein [Spirochaetia bacterium]
MRIRAKIIFVVIPILMSSLIITGVVSSFSARSGMTRVAIEFLGFKAEELENYAYSQWNLLEQNRLHEDERYLSVAKNAVASYAESIIRSDTELIIALDADARVAMASDDIELTVVEKARLYRKIHQEEEGWVNFTLGNVERVGQSFSFPPFDWYILVTESSQAFYREADQIIVNTGYVLGGSIVLSLIMLFFFSGYLTRPIRLVVKGMHHIIETNDLSHRVPVEYDDEIGRLAHTFNMMSTELERAYNQIKEFAFKAVLAQKNEHKVRSIFQKYVPKDVIDTIFMNPERMLVGDNRVVAILFSDIRSFTTISEGFMPDELVSALNRYFEMMVDIIISHGGVIDKYIGDAIMAFFGAPVKHEDDAVQAVLAAVEMQEALRSFNEEQSRNGKPEFKTGIGINYGVVTVGNIGSEKKMDYTIIGDMVNLGSRLEGLTKPYQQSIIFSESVYRKAKGKIPCRLVDKVVVKGKTTGENIYTAERTITARQKKAWQYHHTGLKYYYQRHFNQALKYFAGVKKFLPDDYLADLYIERCRAYIKSPPPAGWSGVEVLTSK